MRVSSGMHIACASLHTYAFTCHVHDELVQQHVASEPVMVVGSP